MTVYGRNIVALDPGKRCVGLAWCAGGNVRAVGMPRIGKEGNGLLTWWQMGTAAGAKIVELLTPQVGHWGELYLVCEVPQWIRKVPPADLGDLVAVVAAAAMEVKAAFPSCRLISVHPAQWKGNMDGDAFVERTVKKATPALQELVGFTGPAGLQHNVWDAVALAWWADRQPLLLEGRLG